MKKTEKIGISFIEGSVPNLGSIERNDEGNLFLLAEDIPKLNTMVTKAACLPHIENSNDFTIYTGDTAFILDWISAETASVYTYHSGTDHWYETIPN